MKVVTGLTLAGGSLALDDTRFVDCRFTDCELLYSGRPVILERTSLKGCRYIFSGRAKMTLEFLDCVGLLPMTSAMRAKSSADGETALIVH